MGPGLYQDDVTCDIRTSYLDWLRVGKTNLEATTNLLEDEYDIWNDEEDGPLFWFTLADTQWKYGKLLDEVKEQALYYIQNGKNLELK